MEETRLMQQLRSARHRGSDMSSEDVRLSKAATGVAEDQSIGSLTQNFTGQRVQVNTLDKRMEEYIEQEMARRKAARSDNSQSEEAIVAEPITKEDVEQEEKEEKEKNLSTKQKSTNEKPAQLPPSTTVIDLSDTILRATSSSSAQPTTEPTKKWHKHEGAAPTTGILEVELPVEEQLRMFEATREAALKALKEQRKRKPRPNRDLDSGFGDLGDATTAAGNVSSDFSKRTFGYLPFCLIFVSFVYFFFQTRLGYFVPFFLLTENFIDNRQTLPSNSRKPRN